MEEEEEDSLFVETLCILSIIVTLQNKVSNSGSLFDTKRNFDNHNIFDDQKQPNNKNVVVVSHTLSAFSVNKMNDRQSNATCKRGGCEEYSCKPPSKGGDLYSSRLAEGY